MDDDEEEVIFCGTGDLVFRGEEGMDLMVFEDEEEEVTFVGVALGASTLTLRF